jgi:hypothetical protein
MKSSLKIRIDGIKYYLFFFVILIFLSKNMILIFKKCPENCYENLSADLIKADEKNRKLRIFYIY